MTTTEYIDKMTEEEAFTECWKIVYPDAFAAMPDHCLEHFIIQKCREWKFNIIFYCDGAVVIRNLAKKSLPKAFLNASVYENKWSPPKPKEEMFWQLLSNPICLRILNGNEEFDLSIWRKVKVVPVTKEGE